MANEDKYIDGARRATEAFVSRQSKSDAKASAALAAKDDANGTGSIGEHAFLSARELKILRKLDSALINKDLYDDYSCVLTKVAAQTTNPLPVMERTTAALNAIDNALNDGAFNDLLDIIDELKRERGLTEAAHVDKLKEE